MNRGLENKKILLGITGGIAAYKSVFLLRLLKTRGADVRVVMTESACQFVAPLTFETLSEHPVQVRLFGAGGDQGTVSPVEHIELAKWPDLVVIAPTTANTLSKLVAGGADDLLSNVVSAYEGTVVLAPAMNDVMWRNKSTQENLQTLSHRGYRVISPGTGDLACGYEAEGRMAEPERILDFVERLFDSDFGNLKVLVSVGGTEEDLDPVRVISNRSSGKMGFAIAEAARDRGAQVTAVVGRVSVPPPVGVRVLSVRTSADMSSAVKQAFVEADVLIMAAAVADYKASSPLVRKKKGDTWTLELIATEDILESIGKMKGRRFIVGFALETDNIEENAKEKLVKKNCDLLVVNNPLEDGAAFEHDTNSVLIYNTKGLLLETGIKSKREIADIVLQVARKEKNFQKILV
ncbi:MAG: bifunctional phosphopantothenoylcysteine decarboxylase/phosphopantothenate--cysteine ligase CoaBC [Candidatus Krumholzibacteria bacterium]|nr:bifunctional phosphopantothenoylcysteine decarboxylase/phosphopantothenate--cysteine ligase CoaBC [Candidatus Krumholzibacteria bacterium]